MKTMSRDRDVNPPALAQRVRFQLDCLSESRRVQQKGTQPWRVGLRKAKGLAKYSRLVAPARMGGTEAVVFDLAKIEDQLIAARQSRHDRLQ
jgi:hypothetical protein